MMWLIPVAALAGTVVAAVAKTTKLKALPADVAGILRGGLQSNNDAQLTATLAQVEPTYPRQVAVIRKAWGATKAHDGQLNVPADINGTYMVAFHSGDPSMLVATAKALDVKYHFLATHLNEMASLLGALAAKAA